MLGKLAGTEPYRNDCARFSTLATPPNAADQTPGPHGNGVARSCERGRGPGRLHPAGSARPLVSTLRLRDEQPLPLLKPKALASDVVDSDSTARAHLGSFVSVPARVQLNRAGCTD